VNATIFTPAVIAIATLAAQPVQAQFFGIGKKKSADPATSQPCQPSEARTRRNSIFGALASSIAGSALGSAGAGGTVAGLALPIGSLLSSAIMAKLDCKEQVQAAEATTNAVRGGVGTSSTWTSGTRANVSGTSTVTGENKLADGTSCVTVTDVVIVDGEETTAPKRMCRKPGASGYALAA
jgi:surface antigen